MVGVAIRYSLNMFSITSDSLAEYQTYLLFIQVGSWRPITDNMLSTSIWTTYLPAVIQRYLMLENPETVYRITLAVLVATTPSMLYLVARRYTGYWMAGAVTLVLFTSFYYSGYATYARMHVALSWFLLVIYFVTSTRKDRYIYIVIATFGLIVSHYTVVIAYTPAIVTAAAATILLKRKDWRTITFAAVTLIVGFGVYYGWIARYAHVLKYLSYGIRQLVRDVTGFRTPTWGSITPEIGTENYQQHSIVLPDANVAGSPLERPIDSYQSSDKFDINPIANERYDFTWAKRLVLLRFAVYVVVLVGLIRRREWRNPLVFLTGIIVLLSTVGIWLPVVAQTIGSMRLPYMSLPLELLTLAYWQKGRRETGWLGVVIVLFGIIVYH